MNNLQSQRNENIQSQRNENKHKGPVAQNEIIS